MGENIRKTEILKTFNSDRTELKPYGLTCEQWRTDIMPRYDRHNEIELNYFPEGGVTYFLQDRRVTVPPRCLTLFWGLVPHRIVHYDVPSQYYVCTIPLSVFLGWGLPEAFTTRVFKGEMLMDKEHERYAHYDCLLMENWYSDLLSPNNQSLVLMEMQSRLQRMSYHASVEPMPTLQSGESNLIERMTLFIAQNYHLSIRLSDIGKSVGLHPDYANTLFKKAFGHTLNTHLIMERVTQAQRLLLTTATPIVQIAYECGFNSISCFNSAFLKYNGCTPRDYRKNFEARK